MFTLRRIGIFSVAKMAGGLYFLISLLFVPFLLLFAAIGAFAAEGMDRLGAVPLVLLAVFIPFIYGLMGFLIGALMALIYNFVAGRFGGIELQLEPKAGATMAATVATS